MNVVELGGFTVQEGRMALYAITRAVPPEIVASRAVKDTVAKA